MKTIIAILLFAGTVLSQSQTSLLLLMSDKGPKISDSLLYFYALDTALTEEQEDRLRYFDQRLCSGWGVDSLSEKLELAYFIANETRQSSITNFVQRDFDGTDDTDIGWLPFDGMFGDSTGNNFIDTEWYHSDSTISGGGDFSFGVYVINLMEDTLLGMTKAVMGSRTASTSDGNSRIVPIYNNATGTYAGQVNGNSTDWYDSHGQKEMNHRGLYAFVRTGFDGNDNFLYVNDSITEQEYMPYNISEGQYTLFNFGYASGNESNASLGFAFIGKALTTEELDTLNACVEWYLQDIDAIPTDVDYPYNLTIDSDDLAKNWFYGEPTSFLWSTEEYQDSSWGYAINDSSGLFGDTCYWVHATYASQSNIRPSLRFHWEDSDSIYADQVYSAGFSIKNNNDSALYLSYVIFGDEAHSSAYDQYIGGSSPTDFTVHSNTTLTGLTTDADYYPKLNLYFNQLPYSTALDFMVDKVWFKQTSSFAPGVDIVMDSVGTDTVDIHYLLSGSGDTLYSELRYDLVSANSYDTTIFTKDYKKGVDNDTFTIRYKGIPRSGTVRAGAYVKNRGGTSQELETGHTIYMNDIPQACVVEPTTNQWHDFGYELGTSGDYDSLYFLAGSGAGTMILDSVSEPCGNYAVRITMTELTDSDYPRMSYTLPDGLAFNIDSVYYIEATMTNHNDTGVTVTYSNTLGAPAVDRRWLSPGETQLVIWNSVDATAYADSFVIGFSGDTTLVDVSIDNLWAKGQFTEEAFDDGGDPTPPEPEYCTAEPAGNLADDTWGFEDSTDNMTYAAVDTDMDERFVYGDSALCGNVTWVLQQRQDKPQSTTMRPRVYFYVDQDILSTSSYEIGFVFKNFNDSTVTFTGGYGGGWQNTFFASPGTWDADSVGTVTYTGFTPATTISSGGYFLISFDGNVNMTWIGIDNWYIKEE